MNPPVITAIFAAILGLIAAGLTVNVIMHRVRLGVESGDGGQPQMTQAIRAHANFAEHVPLALILIGSAEMLIMRAWIIYALGITLLVARLLSMIGLTRSLGPSFPRQAGAGLTILVITVTSILILCREFGLV
jgi:uncharacterized membrane protein YecN with MAPEG domain